MNIKYKYNSSGIIFIDNCKLFTGFKDCNGIDIFEGDRIGDWTEIDGDMVRSDYKVFWNQQTGSWLLDISKDQDESAGAPLWEELRDFKYQIVG